jgi:hypothetical protein
MDAVLDLSGASAPVREGDVVPTNSGEPDKIVTVGLRWLSLRVLSAFKLTQLSWDNCIGTKENFSIFYRFLLSPEVRCLFFFTTHKTDIFCSLDVPTAFEHKMVYVLKRIKGAPLLPSDRLSRMLRVGEAFEGVGALEQLGGIIGEVAT